MIKYRVFTMFFRKFCSIHNGSLAVARLWCGFGIVLQSEETAPGTSTVFFFGFWYLEIVGENQKNQWRRARMFFCNWPCHEFGHLLFIVFGQNHVVFLQTDKALVLQARHNACTNQVCRYNFNIYDHTNLLGLYKVAHNESCIQISDECQHLSIQPSQISNQVLNQTFPGNGLQQASLKKWTHWQQDSPWYGITLLVFRSKWYGWVKVPRLGMA